MGTGPKFFCEYCGTEVRQSDKFCRHCGKFFSSVKCPSCGFSGDSKLFRDGCPACGYAVYRDGGSARGGSGGRGRKGRSFDDWLPRDKKNGRGADPLPWWIYLASLVFVALLMGLVILRR